MPDADINFAVRLLSRRVFRRLASPLMRQRCTIFLLHRLQDVENDIQGHSIDFIKATIGVLRESGARLVSLRTAIEVMQSGLALESDMVAFTIDDGFADQSRMVEEAFIEMNCPVTVFLISDFLDGKLWPWDDQLAYAIRNSAIGDFVLNLRGRSFPVDLRTERGRAECIWALQNFCKQLDADPYQVVTEVAGLLKTEVPVAPPPAFRPMTWSEARRLERLGAEFGPHSVSHRIFSRLTEAESRLELGHSWGRLQQELRRPCPVFAWPTGRRVDFSERDMNQAQSAGLMAAVSTIPDFAHLARARIGNGAFAIPRFGLPEDLTTVLRYSSWLERARQILPW